MSTGRCHRFPLPRFYKGHQQHTRTPLHSAEGSPRQFCAHLRATRFGGSKGCHGGGEIPPQVWRRRYRARIRRRPPRLPGEGALSFFPCLRSWHGQEPFYAIGLLEFPRRLGPTHPCTSTVRTEPFPSPALRGLTRVIATSTKICTSEPLHQNSRVRLRCGRHAPLHALLPQGAARR